jgi:hypothetical protein
MLPRSVDGSAGLPYVDDVASLGPRIVEARRVKGVVNSAEEVT